MKKFLMYVIIVVTCLFLGFTIYYLTLNNENIYIAISKDESIYRNEDESILLDDLITWTKPSKGTTLSINSADESVVTYNEESKRFDCVGGGSTVVTITPSNENFGPFVFEIYVGNGDVSSPYVIDSVEDLAQIGNSTVFDCTKSYILTKDLDLSTINNGIWTPIPEFSGHFNGNSHTIYNLNVESATSAGFFSSLTNIAFVENIKFQDANLVGTFENVGVVAGINKGTIGKIEVKSAHIENENTSKSSYAGAIVGTNQMDKVPAMVNMCSANADIISNSNAGGLVGLNKSSIILNSRSIVKFESKNNLETESVEETTYFGGIAAVNESTRIEDPTNQPAQDGGNGSTEGENLVYYASAIKNSYTVVNGVVGTTSFGAVVGNNNEAQLDGQMFYNIYEGCIYALNYNVEGSVSAVAGGVENLTADATTNLILKTNADLVKKSTYEDLGYNFDSVWEIKEKDFAFINYLGSYEIYNIIAIGNEVTPDVMPLDDFLNNVRENLAKGVTSNSVYKVNKDVEIDLGGQEWITIAPDSQKPMLASIETDDGVKCVIKNFKLKDKNSSFFGYIGTNTSIKGITFENVIVESCTADNSGVVATELMKVAKLDGITVKNYISINSQAGNAGIICGHNLGEITNCSVLVTVTDNNPYKDPLPFTVSFNKETNAGAIVGNNEGVVNNCTVDGVKFCIDVQSNMSEKTTICFGGIAGVSSSTLSNNKVLGYVCDTTATGFIYGGGVVGRLKKVDASSSRVDKCYSLAAINCTKTSSDDTYIGGIVGYAEETTIVKGCYHKQGTLYANNVGGIVGCSFGTIQSSYVAECELEGYRVGGLASKINGEVTDCYVDCSLKSLGGDGIICGFSVLLGENCYVAHCFSNAKFSGDGKYYAESYSEFRVNAAVKWLYKDVLKKPTCGIVKENIVLVNNNAIVQKSSAVLNQKEGWIDATYDQCTGKTGNYEVFKNHGFNGSNTYVKDIKWIFGGNGFPTLAYIAEPVEEVA